MATYYKALRDPGSMSRVSAQARRLAGIK